MKPPPTTLLCLLLIVTVLSGLNAEETKSVGLFALPNCNDTCGKESIPYPFGIGAGCFLDLQYAIDCRASPHSGGSFRPFLSKFDLEVKNISASGGTVVGMMPPMNVCLQGAQTHFSRSIDFSGSPYDFSTRHNDFFMEGCAGSAVLFNKIEEYMAGCATVCGGDYNNVISANKCYGIDCCQMSILSASYILFPFYHIDFQSQESGPRRNCLAATLIKSSLVDKYTGKLSADTVPVVLDWRWINNKWPHNNTDLATCTPYQETNSTFCRCKHNHFGNPYISNGCQVPEECTGCEGCDSFQGSYICSSSPWNILDAIFNLTTLTVFSIAIGPLLLVFGTRWLYGFIKRRRKTERRVNFFKLKLKQHKSSSKGVVERTKLFTQRQLDKATNHFSENRVLGKGGQGVVYKGMLTDGKIVAIKKSKLLDETQMEQFINEVVILSQINHRNVVNLLGCCLETEIPLLVYEFISNGTLSQHIHGLDEDFALTWPMRLKIAADSAGALAYLHSSSSSPIYHRDVKSANILLDEKHRAKVSDFGCSKTIAIDQTHLTTLVQGTIGYLDPEYFESNIYTEKSDVYSFGVVLLELLTSKKPIYRSETMEQRSLLNEFFLHMENSSLSDILDNEVVKEAKEEELAVVVDLAKQCLNGYGKMRPTMKEVAMTLELIIKSPAHVTLNQEALMARKSATIENTVTDKSWPNKFSTGGASSSFSVGAEPLLFDFV